MTPAVNSALTLLLAITGFFLPWIFGGGGAIFSALVLIAIFAVMSYGLDIIVSDLGEAKQSARYGMTGEPALRSLPSSFPNC